jgi:hypothetical protein
MAVKSPTDRLDELLAFFELSPAQLAQMLGVPPLIVERWMARESNPSGVNRREIERLAQLKDLLMTQFKGLSTAAREWLKKLNAALGGHPPIEILRTRGPREVLEYLEMPDEPAYA